MPFEKAAKDAKSNLADLQGQLDNAPPGTNKSSLAQQVSKASDAYTSAKAALDACKACQVSNVTFPIPQKFADPCAAQEFAVARALSDLLAANSGPYTGIGPKALTLKDIADAQQNLKDAQQALTQCIQANGGSTKQCTAICTGVGTGTFAGITANHTVKAVAVFDPPFLASWKFVSFSEIDTNDLTIKYISSSNGLLNPTTGIASITMQFWAADDDLSIDLSTTPNTAGDVLNAFGSMVLRGSGFLAGGHFNGSYVNVRINFFSVTPSPLHSKCV